MKSHWQALSIYTLFILITAGSGYWGWTIRQENTALKSALQGSIVQYTEANLAVGRAETTIKNLTSERNLLSQQLKKEIKTRQEKETLIARIEATLKDLRDGLLSTPKPTVNPDEVPPANLDQYLGSLLIVDKDAQGKVTLHKVENMPFAYKDFRIDINGDVMANKVQYSLHQLFSIKFVETRGATGLISHYAELQELNSETKEVVNKLALTDFTVVKAPVVPTQNKMRWFNPTVDIAVGLNIGKSLTPKIGFDAGVSFLSYGEPGDKQQLLRFGRVSIGRNPSGATVGIAPAMLNISKTLTIPVLRNIWLIPSLNRELNTSTTVFGLSIGATL